ncbi:MAG: 16S rRNA (adenine(1518)-N(6)/adenine(1519)-N(6))-dimethyltransferase RsmA [Halomonadaceae bacterium]|nr:MAG: 16S rRNA (adenine(1518)-N(6)/adenine(1519)-N(6))-dimethyltransferase RsmA [Halomonadaceae bacterium]
MSRQGPPVHQARKRFGQNFLHDAGVIDRIVRAISPKIDDNLLEIGPGMGALTESLVLNNPSMTVLELDRDLVPGLRTQFFSYPEFTVLQGDALRFDYSELVAEKPLRIVGNLPYNISTPLIFHLLNYADRITDMHFMLQKEVVQRMAAVPGDSQWGRLAVMTQYQCQVQPLFPVGSGAFKPAPKVESAIVRLMPYDTPPIPAKDRALLAKVVRTAFSARRKTLRKAMAVLLNDDDWPQLGIDPGLRPQNLTLANFVAIADYLYERPAGDLHE